MLLTSPDFDTNKFIPTKFGYRHGNVSPTLRIDSAPTVADCLAILLFDPDAPNGNFTHWITWNIPPETIEVSSSNIPGSAISGLNDMGSSGYMGPAPPSGVHHYHFVVYALKTKLGIPQTSQRTDFDRSIAGVVLEKTELIGLYSEN